MWKLASRWLLLAVVTTVSLAHAEGPLVSAEWLARNLQREDLLLIDASPAKLHAAGHIPGAVNVDIFSFGGVTQIPAAEMERRIRSWGVSPGRKVVLHDQGGSYFATSLFFDLLYHGFAQDDLAVLDGGVARWQAIGGALTREPTPAPRPGTFRVAKLDEDLRVRLPEFLAASGDPANHALVEALDPAQHFGGMKFFDRAGHVPNAIMTPVSDYFNADNTFKPPQEIRRMLSHLGIRREQQIHAHCGGGIAASVPFFAAKLLLGYPRVKLYKESQLEWLRDDRGLPFWTYDAPHLLRDKGWVNGWGGKMLRAYGVSKLSVIDVRPAEAFAKAHLPFAINVPGEIFRRNLATPAKLAEALGAAGVVAAHEAVIVSSGGLNPDSALAYLMLEMLGQKRVSVFSDSVDEWGFAGLPLDKAPGPPAAAREYPVQLRHGILIGELRQAEGQYPKVYLASGKSLPATPPRGKVVHVPYSELVAADGKPKAAKDLWSILEKAGVSRYAEIVTVSDEPGEAAANYFILKLMGFPDVKVQM